MNRHRQDPAEAVTFEHQLLLQCLDGTGGVSAIASVRDWDRTVVDLMWHGVAPLAAVTLTDADLSAKVPQRALATLKQIRGRCTLFHKTVLDVLRDLDPRFRQRRVRYAILKGPFLYEAYYRGFPRPYGDLDLVVAEADLEPSIEILESMGYAVEGSRLNRFLMRRGHFHLVLKPESRNLPMIELHWSLVDRANLYRIDDAAVMARVTDFAVGETMFSTLSKEDTFLYLCLHIVKHGILNSLGLRSGYPAEWFCRRTSGNRLIWFIDLDFFLQKEMEHVDWQVVAARAREWNVVRDIEDSLKVLGLVLPGSRADEVLKRIGFQKTSDAGRQRAMERFLQTPRGHRVLGRMMEMHPDFIFRPARLLFLGHLLFPSRRDIREYHRARAAWPLPLLYLVHPFHMLLKLLSLTAWNRPPKRLDYPAPIQKGLS